jgi:CDP-diacylglycerol--glycerol-3-phosphate 3-phosphatidyltransferase
MRQVMNTLPNQLTGLRLLLIPILWALALLRLEAYVGIGLVVAFLTDALDGPIARRLNLTSDFGSKLDSLADNLLTPSAAIWLLLLRPEVFRDHPGLWLVALAIYASSLLVGWLKFRRFANLHLYSSKAGGLRRYSTDYLKESRKLRLHRPRFCVRPLQ